MKRVSRARQRVRRARIACARAAFVALGCSVLGVKIAEYRSFAAGVAFASASLILAALLLYKGGWLAGAGSSAMFNTVNKSDSRNRAA